VTRELRTEVLVVGGGLGGVAAALGALRAGRRVVLTERYDWLGGQLTSQAVPPDEHPWIESFGCTAAYRGLREAIRDYYRRHYPLTEAARRARRLNPGAGTVGPLCHEPRVAVAVLDQLLAPWRGSGLLTVLQPYRPVEAWTDSDTVTAVRLAHRDEPGRDVVVDADYVVDATELGDLAPLTGAEHVTGFESADDTGEPSAPPVAQPLNMQAFSVCFVIDHVDGDHTVDRPRTYDRWRSYQPSFWGAPLLSWTAPEPRTLRTSARTFTPNPDGDPLEVRADQSADPGDWDQWTFRRIAARRLFRDGAYPSDVVLVNWPSMDYFEGPLVGVPEAEAAGHLEAARELSRSLLYWMQTEAPRPDGGTGHPGLRLRGDVVGDTADGLAMAPYVRESRRLRTLTRVVEQDLSLAVRGEHGAVRYPDSVGVGSYRIDLHPSTGGDNYIDVGACPFEIPLGALVPVRLRNLLPGAKNIGTTHITNGCYRLHPVEWNVGEVAGALAAFCLDRKQPPQAVPGDAALLAEFRDGLARDGVELHWPRVRGY
jgi:hypothetical protein